jgi:hypothetical protein
MLPKMRKRTRRTSRINNDRLVHRALLEGDDAIAIEFTCGGATERDDIIENHYARLHSFVSSRVARSLAKRCDRIDFDRPTSWE